MNSRFRSFSLLSLLLLLGGNALAQCDPFFLQPLSLRPANYDIRVTLDDQRHTIDATQTIRFTNTSPEPVRELRMYMYLNAFKNTQSSFLKGTAQIFGQGYTVRTKEDWGWIDIEKIGREGGADLSGNMRYVQLDDSNTEDQSVLEVALDKPVLPGETAVFNLKWRAQMPKTIARAGPQQGFLPVLPLVSATGRLGGKQVGQVGLELPPVFPFNRVLCRFWRVRCTHHCGR